MTCVSMMNKDEAQQKTFIKPTNLFSTDQGWYLTSGRSPSEFESLI